MPRALAGRCRLDRCGRADGRPHFRGHTYTESLTHTHILQDTCMCVPNCQPVPYYRGPKVNSPTGWPKVSGLDGETIAIIVI